MSSRVVFCDRCKEAAALEWTWARADEARVCMACMAQAITEAMPLIDPMPSAVLLHRLFHSTEPSRSCSLCWGSQGMPA